MLNKDRIAGSSNENLYVAGGTSSIYDFEKYQRLVER